MDYFRTYMFRKIVGNIIRIKPRWVRHSTSTTEN
jgi:hypothetical protein